MCGQHTSSCMRHARCILSAACTTIKSVLYSQVSVSSSTASWRWPWFLFCSVCFCCDLLGLHAHVMQNLTSCCLLAWYVLHLMNGMVDTSEDCEICCNLIPHTRYANFCKRWLKKSILHVMCVGRWVWDLSVDLSTWSSYMFVLGCYLVGPSFRGSRTIYWQLQASTVQRHALLLADVSNQLMQSDARSSVLPVLESGTALLLPITYSWESSSL